MSGSEFGSFGASLLILQASRVQLACAASHGLGGPGTPGEWGSLQRLAALPFGSPASSMAEAPGERAAGGRWALHEWQRDRRPGAQLSAFPTDQKTGMFFTFSGKPIWWLHIPLILSPCQAPQN